MMNFFPAILTDAPSKAEMQIDQSLCIDEVDVVQIDVIDGHLADNVTITPLDLSGFEFGRLQIDFHFMVEEPMNYVREMTAVKDRIPIRVVIAQIERMSSQREFIRDIRTHGWKTGLGLDLFTPLEAVDENLWKNLDVIQLMGIKMGFQGKKLHKSIFQKIKDTKALLAKEKCKTKIYVDGGVKLKNAKKLLEAGADGLAVGSALWTSENPVKTAKKLIAEFQKLLIL